MRHGSRLLLTALVTTVTLVGATVTPAFAVAQSAIASAAVDSSTRVAVEGTLVVLAGDDEATTTTVVAQPLADEVRLVTSTGESVELTGELTEDVTTGSTFAGTIAIPVDAVSEINAVVETAMGETAPPVAADTVDAESAVGSEILSASAALDAPLAVAEATITPEAIEAGQVATAHTLDVVVVTLPTDPAATVMSDDAIVAMTDTLSTYWASQSAGQVASISKPAAVKRLVSANACNPNAIWDEAAAQFGTAPIWYWGFSPGEHLVVIAPEACGGGSGLGTVGSPHAGGLIWTANFDVLATQTMAHEFGHNLGLRHSNMQQCLHIIYSVSVSADCADQEYGDYYDVMGGGLYYYDALGAPRSNQQLMALNVTQKSVLGALSTSDLPSVRLEIPGSSSASSFTLMPASAESGIRGITATDPRSGDVYFVEYRSGTGIDSGSIYAAGVVARYRPGVRVLRLRADGTSAVYAIPTLFGSQSNAPLAMQAGQTFSRSSGGLSIQVIATGAAAAVTIRLDDSPLPLTTATPTISDAMVVFGPGVTITADPGVWGPAPVTLAYQWLRSGVPVEAATASTYALTDSDVGATMSVTVTGSKTGYATATMTSLPTRTVSAPPVTLTTAVPTITGTLGEGHLLTADPGMWEPAPVTFTYQWSRDLAQLPGQTAATYRLTAGDIGATITVSVSGSSGGTTSLPISSEPTAPIAAAIKALTAAPIPTISGTTTEGRTLTADSGAWGPAPVDLSYQWSRGGADIPGATELTYLLVPADEGQTITVTVTGSKAGYTTQSKTSEQTTAIAVAIKELTSSPVPTVSGETKVGSLLTADAGLWGPDDVTLAYQWYRAGDEIAGATNSTYALTVADAARTITVLVTGLQAGYASAARMSAATAAVASGTLTTGTTTITGTTKVGYAVTANAGTWGPSGVKLAYQWYRTGAPIAGATTPRYLLAGTDAGKVITVKVTGTLTGYASAAKVSAATGAVTPGTLGALVPTITGTKKVGSALTANPGVWTPSMVKITYQWYRTGTLITGATGKTYVLAAGDLAKKMTVKVTGSTTGYATTARLSSATTAVVAGTLTAPTPTISGTKRVGYTLTANSGTWGPGTVTLTYRWYRSGVAITGASAKTYRLVSADRYDTIKVRVTGVKMGYTGVGKYSASTVKIP